MKCSKCNSEWTSERTSSQIIYCPSCGAPLVSDLGKSDELTMQDVVPMIVECFGPEIISQEKRFLAVFKDFAPKLQYEHKILKIAFGEDIAGFFLDCPVEQRTVHVEKAAKALDAILSKEASNQVVQAFLNALGWNKKTTDTVDAQDEKRKIHKERLKETMKNIESSDAGANAPKTAVRATAMKDSVDDEGSYASQRITSAASMARRVDGEYLKKGTECQKDGRYDEAVRWYRQAADLGNAYAKRALLQIEKEQQDLIDQGDKYRKQGKLEAAIKCYQSAVDKAGSKAIASLAQVLLEQGNACRDKGDMQEAMKWYQLADENGNDKAKETMSDALLMFGDKCRDKGDMKEAMNWYRLADNVGNSHAKDELNEVQEISNALAQGGELRKQGNLDEATDAYQKALNKGYIKAKDAISSILLEKKGNAAYNSGDIDSAMKYYQMAIDQGDVVAREAIAEIMFEEGKGCYECGFVEDSVKWLKMAARNGNDSIKMKIAEMCKVILGSGDLQALRDLSKVISENEIKITLEADPLIAKACLHAGDDFYRTNDADMATFFYQLATSGGFGPARRRINELASMMLGKGRSLLSAGNKDEAMQWYKRAADLGNDSAAEALRRM